MYHRGKQIALYQIVYQVEDESENLVLFRKVHARLGHLFPLDTLSYLLTNRVKHATSDDTVYDSTCIAREYKYWTLNINFVESKYES